MKHDLEIAYLGLEVPDPSSLSSFFGDVIGLLPGEPIDQTGSLTWRDDDRSHRLIISPGPANDESFVGFEAVDSEAFARVMEQLASQNVLITEATPEQASSRGVARMVTAPAPWGGTIELVEGLKEATSSYDSPLMPGGFKTEGVGFGHVVLATTNFDESDKFLVEGLGFRQSDWIETEIAEGIELEVRFYHCNARHHTIALAKPPFELPQTLHHVMFETNIRDDVGAAFDRVWSTDLAIPNGLGRHDNDQMFSFYVASPAGFQVEVGYGAREVTTEWDGNHRYDRISSWGHQALRPLFV
jgi:2,3-dihydroxybiphenyl 1,2-dioxygenase